MKTIWMMWMMAMACVSANPTDDFIEKSLGHHGADGEKAARFLVEHMPNADKKSLTSEYLTNNLDLAFQARVEFPWAKTIPEEIFFNDVLPYAVFDETRDSWRAEFMQKARPLVKDAKTASEAAEALNREWFKLVKVHYNTGRKKPNQSPVESMESGRATCTGLSIILVDACRAVGIPARAVGTPLWSNGLGNHTWVEIWDGDWKFTGADEYDPQGLNRGWFTKDAAKAKAEVLLNAIYATSWKNDGVWFPLVWDPENHAVAAVNVTARYAKPATNDDTTAKLGVRLFDAKNGRRIIAKVTACDASGHLSDLLETKAGTSDLNDMPRITLTPGAKGLLFFISGGEVREMPFGPLGHGDSTADAVWSNLTPSSPVISQILTAMDVPAVERQSDSPTLKISLSQADAMKVVALLVGEQLKNPITSCQAPPSAEKSK